MLEYTKGVTRSYKSKEDKQYNHQQKKDKNTNNDLQSTTQKTKDWGIWTLLENRNG
jgi:cytosine/uracil/thiamine/allantoin permease